MELHAEAYRRALAPFRVDVPPVEVFRVEGARSETIIRDFLEARGHHATDEQVARLAQEKQDLFLSLGPPQLYPGAEALVRRLRRATSRLGLVTGTRRENLDRLIPHLLPLFDGVLAQDGYHHDKPHPEPYLESAKLLDLPPAACAALENAPRGVMSAKRAGYGLVVALTTTTERASLAAAGADVVLDRHADAARALVPWLGDSRGRPGAG